MVSSICGRVSFVPISYIGVPLLKWLSAAPCCTSPSDLQRMSSVTAGPGSSRGMLMDLFGSLPLEAGGMDLFHLMSVWGSGGEERITGWHRFNWQGEEEEGKKDTMQCFTHQTESWAQIILGGLFQFTYFGQFKVTPVYAGTSGTSERSPGQRTREGFRCHVSICCRWAGTAWYSHFSQAQYVNIPDLYSN